MILLHVFLAGGNGGVTYVASIPPLSAILQEIVHERAEVTPLLPVGASPHVYDPRPSDARRIAEAAALFSISDDLDGWSTRFDAKRKVQALSLLPESFTLKFEEEEASDSDGHARHGHEHHGKDPHFWTDPLAVKALIPGLLKSLCEIDPEGCAIYRKNGEIFAAKLENLHRDTARSLQRLQGVRVALSHPFYRYFFRRYGLHAEIVVEPVPGKDPSPRAVMEMAGLLKRKKVRALFTMPQHSDKAARVLAETAGIPVVQLNPLGREKKETYDALIRKNTARIEKALP